MMYWNRSAMDANNMDTNDFFPDNLMDSAFFASLSIGLALIDSHQNIINVNPVFGQMIGLSTSLLLGKKIDFLAKFIQPTIVFKKTDSERINIYQVTKPNFEKKNMLVSTNQVFHVGKPTGFFAIQMIDCSESMETAVEQQKKIEKLNKKR